MCVCKLKTIWLTVSEISSGKEIRTQTHGQTLWWQYPSSWAGDKNDVLKKLRESDLKQPCEMRTSENFVMRCIKQTTSRRSTAVQSQNAVYAYFTSKQILSYGFAQQRTGHSFRITAERMIRIVHQQKHQKSEQLRLICKNRTPLMWAISLRRDAAELLLSWVNVTIRGTYSHLGIKGLCLPLCKVTDVTL